MEVLKEKIKRLYQNNPHIHITLSLSRPKRITEEMEATIVGAYANIFQIEAKGERYTFQYADIISKMIVIDELK